MAEIKHALSLLRRQKKALHTRSRRLAQAFVRLLSCRMALVLAPRSTRRTIRSVTKFEIGGNITRSIILTLPNVHVDGINIKAIAGGVVIVIVVVNIVTGTTPNSGKDVLQAFAHGDSYHLDAVIAPFRAANPLDKACSKFAQDFTDRLAGAVVNHDPQSIAIWLPAQVAGALSQDSQDGTRITQFAEARQIDVVFYGDIECDGQNIVVRPHVVTPALFYQNASEMAGFYNFDDMTSPLAMGTGDNSLEQAARDLAARVVTVIDIGRGFRLLAMNSANEMRQASVLFQHLAEAGGIADRHGLAMLQYLTGKVQITDAVDACNAIDQNLLQQAENSFSRALLYEPEFALAFAYLGNVSVYQAHTLSESTNDEIEDVLGKGLSRYQRALESRVQPADGLAAAVAMVGKAQVKIALHDVEPADTESRPMRTAAVENLNEMIRKFDSAGASKEIRATVALAYALLGDLHRAESNDARALSSYSKVTSLTENRRLLAVVAQSIAELYTARGDACAAARQYLSAAQNVCEADRGKFAVQAEQMQFYCQQSNDARAR